MAISFRGGATAPVMLGNDATTQTLFCIENGIASRVNILVRDLCLKLDTLVALTAVMPLLKVGRGINISGGITLAKGAFDTTMTSDPAVVFRSAMGETAPVTATMADIIHQSFMGRVHTAVEQIHPLQEVQLNVLSPMLTQKDFVLRPGESLVVQMIGAVGTSNAALSNNFEVCCAWEEDEIATFAISGTVTLSGSPVSGAIVTVVESDDTDMTNAILRETIVTGGGGTWASSIRTGKVGAAFVQYENAGTLYTAPGSPYLE